MSLVELGFCNGWFLLAGQLNEDLCQMIQDKNWKVRKEGLDKLKVGFLLIRRFHFILRWAY
jgi:hypothetical protein